MPFGRIALNRPHSSRAPADRADCLTVTVVEGPTFHPLSSPYQLNGHLPAVYVSVMSADWLYLQCNQ